MNIVSCQGSSREVSDICHQISTLEEQFVEHFIGDGDRTLLKQIHFQLKLLKMELKFRETKNH